MNRRTKARIVAFAVVGMAITVLPVRGSAQAERPHRTFPEFVGTWVLDEAASTGRLTMAPPPPRMVTIAITPVDITVTKVLRISEEVRNSPYWTGTETPPPEIYRFDGTEMIVDDSRSERRHSFRLVADALAFTTKETRPNSGGLFNVITDAYSVAGTQLTMQRQLTLVEPPGQLVSMPSNDSRHVFIYRRAQTGNVR